MAVAGELTLLDLLEREHLGRILRPTAPEKHTKICQICLLRLNLHATLTEFDHQ
jgi:hypothetical protein